MSDFESVKPYTQAELDQQAIWANEFDQWWENEGQYQRAGGGQYERSFAWWAWLSREQKQQAKIEKLEIELSTTKQVLGNVIDMEVAKVDSLKTQLNNMEACYIEKKKECEDQQSKIDELNQHIKRLESKLDSLGADRQELVGQVNDLQKQNAWLSDVAERENNRANNLQQDKTSTTILLGKTIQEKNKLQKRINEALVCVDQAKDGFYGYSSDGGDVDNLTKNIEKSLRGER